MECFSALKRKEVLTHATVYMNAAGTVVSEINQSQKDKLCDPTYTGTSVVTFMETARRMKGGCQGLGQRHRECLFEGDRVSVLQEEAVWGTEGGDDFTPM